jgi:hypothetical protein
MSSRIEGSGGAGDAVEAVYDRFFGGLLILHEDIRSDELWGHVYGLTGEPLDYDAVESALGQLSDDGYIAPIAVDEGHTRYDTGWFDERDHADIVDRYVEE